MLYQGVPEYRLSRDLIRAETDQILGLGVELKLNQRLGRDFSVGDLRRGGFVAVFLALGATKGRELRIPGADLDGVINGVDFLLNANLGYRVTLGERVVVIGGGNVAIDVARTALRYSAVAGRRRAARPAPRNCCRPGATTTRSSTPPERPCASVRGTSNWSRSSSRTEMPAHPDEVREAEEEGIALAPGRGPKAIVGP